MKQPHGPGCIHIHMLEQVSGCEVSDGSKTRDASDSDNHVEGGEVVRDLEVRDGGRGVGVA